MVFFVSALQLITHTDTVYSAQLLLPCRGPTNPVTMHPLRPILTFRNQTNDPPGHNVFLISILDISRSSEHLTKLQRTPHTYSRSFEIQRTTHQVTMHSLHLPSMLRDSTNGPPSRNVSLTAVLDVSRSSEQLAKSQCIPRTYSRRFKTQRTARQVTMYSLHLLSMFRDSTNGPPSRNVPLTAVLDVSRSSEQPVKSQCIPRIFSRRFKTQRTARQVTMYSLHLLSMLRDLTNNPPSHNVFLAALLNVSRSNQSDRDIFLVGSLAASI